MISPIYYLLGSRQTQATLKLLDYVNPHWNWYDIAIKLGISSRQGILLRMSAIPACTLVWVIILISHIPVPSNAYNKYRYVTCEKKYQSFLFLHDYVHLGLESIWGSLESSPINVYDFFPLTLWNWYWYSVYFLWFYNTKNKLNEISHDFLTLYTSGQIVAVMIALLYVWRRSCILWLMLLAYMWNMFVLIKLVYDFFVMSTVNAHHFIES